MERLQGSAAKKRKLTKGIIENTEKQSKHEGATVQQKEGRDRLGNNPFLLKMQFPRLSMRQARGQSQQKAGSMSTRSKGMYYGETHCSAQDRKAGGACGATKEPAASKKHTQLQGIANRQSEGQDPEGPRSPYHRAPERGHRQSAAGGIPPPREKRTAHGGNQPSNAGARANRMQAPPSTPQEHTQGKNKHAKRETGRR